MSFLLFLLVLIFTGLDTDLPTAEDTLRFGLIYNILTPSPLNHLHLRMLTMLEDPHLSMRGIDHRFNGQHSSFPIRLQQTNWSGMTFILRGFFLLPRFGWAGRQFLEKFPRPCRFGEWLLICNCQEGWH